MGSLAAIIASLLANPQLISLGESAIASLVNFVTNAWNLHQQGVLTDAQLAAVWAAVGVNVTAADAAWDAALAAHRAASK